MPGADGDEAPPVPAIAPAVDAARRAAVGIVLPVDGLRGDEVAARPRDADLVAVGGEGDAPADRSRAEDGEADVAGGAAARDRHREIAPPVPREVEADHPVGALRIDTNRARAQERHAEVRRGDRRPCGGEAAAGRAGMGLRRGSGRSKCREGEETHAASIDSRVMDERDRPLLETGLDPDPLVQLRRWLDEARGAGIELPETMALATAGRDGAPSARMVLLEDAGDGGLVFYSGYGSRKGRELDENPRAAAVLYWHELGRQVRAEGAVERLPEEQSDAYFDSRPLGSRLSAAVSPQSEVIASRSELERAAATLARRAGEEVARPPDWGGYRLVPEVVGVLAAPGRPAPRPVPLPPSRSGQLARRAAGAVTQPPAEGSRGWLEHVEALEGGDELRAVLAWIAGAGVAVGDDERRAAVRRSMLLLAAGGDPRRALELDGRAVSALAEELDRPGRREALGRGLDGAPRGVHRVCPRVETMLDSLLADGELAWRSYAAGVLGEELAEDDG